MSNMEKVRICYILIVIFVTSFKLALAVFPHGYYVRFIMIEKWNFKELVYLIGEKMSGLNKIGLKFSWGKI